MCWAEEVLGAGLWVSSALPVVTREVWLHGWLEDWPKTRSLLPRVWACCIAKVSAKEHGQGVCLEMCSCRDKLESLAGVQLVLAEDQGARGCPACSPHWPGPTAVPGLSVLQEMPSEHPAVACGDHLRAWPSCFNSTPFCCGEWLGGLQR